MPTITTLSTVATAPVLVKTVMSEDEFLALGETKHHEYYDGMCVVNPPSRRHAAPRPRSSACSTRSCRADISS